MGDGMVRRDSIKMSIWLTRAVNFLPCSGQLDPFRCAKPPPGCHHPPECEIHSGTTSDPFRRSECPWHSEWKTHPACKGLFRVGESRPRGGPRRRAGILPSRDI
jgi:hypothetical protein